jgi:glycosyltransferase involved in cell wall biosynthesis
MAVKITILWSSLASYTHGFFRELAHRGARLQLFHRETMHGEAPYADFDLRCFEQAHLVNDELPIEKLCRDFRPDLCLVVSWNYGRYLRLCKDLRHDGVFVVAATDNQWRGTLRQRLGVLAAPLLLQPAIDAVIVPGDRQAAFMRRLGFKHVVTGWYAVDNEMFCSEMPVKARHRAFLFLGRLVEFKGIHVLIEAYLRYRLVSSDPWELHVVGTGLLKKMSENVEGLFIKGFIQPEEIPVFLNRYRCMILPSLFEPWGVVVHEAVLSGLVVITSANCGAGTVFVRHGYNGFISAVTPEALCHYMLRLEALTPTKWEEFSARSVRLGQSWTMKNLVDLFVDEFIQPRCKSRLALANWI